MGRLAIAGTESGLSIQSGSRKAMRVRGPLVRIRRYHGLRMRKSGNLVQSGASGRLPCRANRRRHRASFVFTAVLPNTRPRPMMRAPGLAD